MLASLALADPSDTPPGPEALARLQRRFPEGRTARVRGLQGERLLPSPAFTSEGVRAVDQDGAVTLTSWSQIEGIDARGGSPGKGAMIGGILGFAFGVGTGFAVALGEESDHALGSWIGWSFLWTGVGAMGGAAVGSAGLPGNSDRQRLGTPEEVATRKAGSEEPAFAREPIPYRYGTGSFTA
jgi:hypothetical protein